MRVEITGLQGGHSGIDIDRGRGNAIKLLARLLWSARQEFPVRVAAIEGGTQYNAIPRDAAAVVAVPEGEVTRLTECVAAFAATVQQELARTEPDLQIAVTSAAMPDMVMTPDAQRRIVDALYGMPQRRHAHERRRARPRRNIDQSRRRLGGEGHVLRGLPGAQRGQLGARRRSRDGRQRLCARRD